MKYLFLFSLLCLFTACQPIQANEQHNNKFVCKSLIDGYLRTQQLESFKPHKITSNNNNLILIYRTTEIQKQAFDIKNSNQMNFECSLHANDTLILNLIEDGKRVVIWSLTLNH